MKKLALILLLIVGMLLSFSAIGLVMLFATGVVESIDDARALMMGEMEGADLTLMKVGETVQVQDALLLLQKQKQELEQDLLTLKTQQGVLQQAKDSLSTQLGNLMQTSQTQNQEDARKRAEGLKQAIALYSALRPEQAAAIMDEIPDDQLILEILPKLKERQAARILNALADPQRKARLSTQLMEGKAVP